MSKQPTTAIPLKLHHVAHGIKGIAAAKEISRFERSFADYTGTKHALAVGSGTSALYVLLLAMKELRPGRDEVVLPAYTVPTLTLAFNSVGLKTVLCDVDRTTFNMSPESMRSVVTDKTLAIIPVHMFGFPCTMKDSLSVAKERGAYVLEDACQSPGAKLDGKRVGAIGDAGIFSLCKGKNISTFHGGLLTTDNDEIAAIAKKIISTMPPRSLSYRLATPAVLTALSFAMRPWFYGAFYKLIKNFKSTEVHETFHPTVYNGFMAAVGNSMMPSIESWNSRRRENGQAIMSGLRDIDGVTLPRIIDGAEPVYNHVPIVVDDISRLETMQHALFDGGIDTGRMYEKSINHIYDLGYKNDPEPFPDADYIAPRLLTLPSHHYLTKADIENMIQIIRG